MGAQVSGGKEVVGGKGEQGRAGSPTPAGTKSLEPKQHLPLVLWRALAALELSIYCLKNLLFFFSFFLAGAWGEETFKNCFGLFLP